MSPSTSPAIFLKDYAHPTFLVRQVDLTLDFQPNFVEVTALLDLERHPLSNQNSPLVLNGKQLDTRSLKIDGQELITGYALSPDQLTISNLPSVCRLETRVRIDPDNNTSLSGLYRSESGYFSQCEAEGFRRITWFPDRPDIMARYRVTLHADPEHFPILLSNGNPAGEGFSPDGRRWARWEDPFPKPSYLFAAVAARLEVLHDHFVTVSGRRVELAIYVQPGLLDQCHHAMSALKKAMAWDEKVFGLECDLDHYMIVAVSDFNMGAMENKGLNIFNTKYVLAREDIATDTDYQNIERVVAHEYFHNWTGNRVTCRDWFQLSLKEGLTVFRDQQFGMDMHSAPVTRIQEIRTLRTAQFPEDAGPMAHPIRPVSYREINNFYTATVYEKGAEVIRMIHSVLGEENFRAGMDLYFSRHDGHAITCEDFLKAMQDTTPVDLSTFHRWYDRAGTPRLIANGHYDAAQKQFTLTLEQQWKPTAYEARLAEAGLDVATGPFPIPVRMGLVGRDGNDLPLYLAKPFPCCNQEKPSTSTVLLLSEPRQTFVFSQIAERPVPSLLRGFSAPVILESDLNSSDLAHLMAFDSDPVNRWDAGQQLATRVLLLDIANASNESVPIEVDRNRFIEACRHLIADRKTDPALIAECLSLPSEVQLAEISPTPINPDRIHHARRCLRRELASTLSQDLRARLYEIQQSLAHVIGEKGYLPDAEQSGFRALANTISGLLSESGPSDTPPPDIAEHLLQQCLTARNMTDSSAALAILSNFDIAQRTIALNAFYQRWQDQPLVVDKWLQIQATSRLAETPAVIRELMKHPAFDLRNPNKVYALVRSFAGSNPLHFHALSGEGYRLVSEVILRLDPINPQVAARLTRCFDSWRRMESSRRNLAKAELSRIASHPQLSSDVSEIVSNALAETV